jgi:hypothetical protein
MRSVWCTLVALCLLAGGTGVRDDFRARPGTSSFHAVHAQVHAAARRAPHRTSVGPFVVTAPATAARPTVVAAVDLGEPRTSAPPSRFGSVYLARGPPRA